MAQPSPDRVDIYARTQKMRGSSVTDRMRTYALVINDGIRTDTFFAWRSIIV